MRHARALAVEDVVVELPAPDARAVLAVERQAHGRRALRIMNDLGRADWVRVEHDAPRPARALRRVRRRQRDDRVERRERLFRNLRDRRVGARLVEHGHDLVRLDAHRVPGGVGVVHAPRVARVLGIAWHRSHARHARRLELPLREAARARLGHEVAEHRPEHGVLGARRSGLLVVGRRHFLSGWPCGSLLKPHRSMQISHCSLRVMARDVSAAYWLVNRPPHEAQTLFFERAKRASGCKTLASGAKNLQLR